MSWENEIRKRKTLSSRAYRNGGRLLNMNRRLIEFDETIMKIANEFKEMASTLEDDEKGYTDEFQEEYQMDLLDLADMCKKELINGLKTFRKEVERVKDKVDATAKDLEEYENKK